MIGMDDKKGKQEFYTLLDECVTAVLSGRRTIEDCLSAYPAYADQLKPELQMVVLVNRLKSPRMTAVSVSALEGRLRDQMPARQASPIRLFHLPAISRAAATILFMFMLFFAGSGGLISASSDTVPGDTLYTVKRAWEGVVIAFHAITGLPEDIWLQLAETRLEEATRLSEEGHLTGEALHDLNEAVERLVQDSPAESMQEIQDVLLAIKQFTTDDLPAFAENETIIEQIRTVIDPVLLPVSMDTPTPQPVDLPSPTPSPRHTATFTPTPTETPSATATTPPTLTVTSSPTETPRFLPTATRTTTAMPTKSATAMPSPTVTATWTAFPTSTPGQVFVTQPPAATQPAVSPLPGQPTFTPSPIWYPWAQATFDAEYITQTAEAYIYRTSTAEAETP